MTYISRRNVLKSAAAGLPLTAVLADPLLAQAVAAGLQDVTIDTQGGKPVKASLALPDAGPAPAVVLVHEWWGLNDQIKSVAAELAKLGYAALAVDLMDGDVATTRDGARAQMQAVKPAEATDTMKSWIDWMRAHEATTDKVGTVGWCFGGGWSLNGSIATPVDATVVYYGRVNRTAEDLKALRGPVQGHFATQDKFIDRKMVNGFESAMAEAGKPLTVHWYEADHAFANPTGARYDEGDAKLSWERTTAFFKQHLG